jgi:hypothetical protein
MENERIITELKRKIDSLTYQINVLLSNNELLQGHGKNAIMVYQYTISINFIL